MSGSRRGGLAAEMIIAGDGPLRGRLERRAIGEQLPVRFAGFVAGREQLAALLASADVVIAPGPAETFGLAALEALACGTPVVVSADSALPEVIGDAGASVAGEDLAAGVRAVLRRPEAERRAAARARAAAFGWDAAVQAFLAVHSPVKQGRHGTLHFDAAGDPATYERRNWSVDRLHPNERGHRLIARRFHGLLETSGFPVGPAPDPEPTSPPATRLAEIGWMATKGTAWVLRRSTDLVPALLALAVRERLSAARVPARET